MSKFQNKEIHFQAAMSHKSKNFHYEVNNQNSVSEISIYGYIGQWEDVDYKGFQNAFRDILSKNKEITVRIHSGGGSVYEGLAIYDLMRSSDSNVIVIIEGMAASMAGVIALGGDVIYMTENAFFMAHAPSGGAFGDKTVMQSATEQLIKAENRLVEIFKERTKAEEDVILGWMEPNKDTWIDSATCKELHICDEVITPSKIRKFQDPKDINDKTPEQIFACYESLSKMSGKPDLNEEKTRDDKLNTNNMNNQNNANWTFNEWQENDPKGLENLSESNPEKFQEIFNNQFRNRSTYDNSAVSPKLLNNQEKWTFSDWIKNDKEGLSNLSKSHPDFVNNLPL